MSLISALRRSIPMNVRANLRRSKTVNSILRWKYGGIHSKKHPHSGHTFFFDGMKNMGWAIGDLKEFEAEDLAFSLKWIDDHQCGCVWDIGANIGFWSLAFCGRPSIKQIYAFEPDPDNLRLLERNRDENRLTQIDIRRVGLSSQSGRVTFYADPVSGTTGSVEAAADFIGTHYGAARIPIEIEVSSIDDQIRDGAMPPDFIKMDVEGHELEALKGGREALTRYRPAIMLEVTANNDEVGQLLRSIGYKLVNPSTGAEIDRAELQTAAIPI